MSDIGCFPPLIDDGFGTYWQLCRPGCDLQIVRPGKAQCDPCENEGADDLDARGS